MMWWFVFTVSPNRERAAEQDLALRGIVARVPLFRRVGRARGRRGARVEYLVPAVPGYVFVALEPCERALARVFESRGIRGMIEFDGQPGKIPDARMQEFLATIAEADVLPVKRNLKAGDEVRIRNGPLSSHKGQIESVKGARANVLLALFGGTSLAVVPVDSLELADTTQKRAMAG